MAIQWVISDSPVEYPVAVAEMERRVAEIHAGTAEELVWLLEHPPLYTAGTSAKDADLLDPDRFPVYRTGRGGQFTYHGPGQRVAYVMLDLRRRGLDVRSYVCALEDWLIETLAAFSLGGERREGRVGIWIARDGAENKIAALGVRIRKWISYHGIALNVDPVLEHFSGIVPCGVPDHGVTSLVAEGLPVTMLDADIALLAAFEKVFETSVVASPLVSEPPSAHAIRGG